MKKKRSPERSDQKPSLESGASLPIAATRPAVPVHVPHTPTKDGATEGKKNTAASLLDDNVEILPPVEAEELVPVDYAEEEPESEGRGIVPYDPLGAYLREIGQYPRLSREEESELALRYYKNKDIEAAYKLVASNLWLVVKIARDYEKAARSVLDLIQEGNIGLMEAVKNFDPYRGVRLPSYAVWWIKAYIVRYVIANWRMVKIGTTQAQRKLFFNLKKERDRLEREGFYPGPKLLADALHVKESEVVEMEQRLGSNDLSVDAPIDENSDSNLLTLLPNESQSAEDILAHHEMSALIKQGFEEFASTLKPNELIIFRERMLGEEKQTLQEIAEKLSISRERVRQIENRLKAKLKEFFEAKFGKEVNLGEV